jgi:hypothetical protein
MTITGNATNKTWATSIFRYAAGVANINGFGYVNYVGQFIGSLFIADVTGTYQITGEPIGTGDGETTSFLLNFDEAYDAAIYVDGVLQNDVSIQDITDGSRSNLSLAEYDAQSTFAIRIPYHETRSDVFIVENRFNATPAVPIFLKTVDNNDYSAYANLSFSNDMHTWVDGFDMTVRGKRTYELPVAWREYRFIKITRTSWDGWTGAIASAFTNMHKAVVFNTPPAAGAVITADYKTPFVPKDENHVYDFSLTIQLGEYTGP